MACSGVAMRAWEEAEGPDARRSRAASPGAALFKTMSSSASRRPARDASTPSRPRGASRANGGLDPDSYVGLDVATDMPFGSDADPSWCFSKGPPRPLREVSFLLGRLAGQVLSRVRLIVAPELRETVVRALGYE